MAIVEETGAASGAGDTTGICETDASWVLVFLAASMLGTFSNPAQPASKKAMNSPTMCPGVRDFAVARCIFKLSLMGKYQVDFVRTQGLGQFSDTGVNADPAAWLSNAPSRAEVYEHIAKSLGSDVRGQSSIYSEETSRRCKIGFINKFLLVRAVPTLVHHKRTEMKIDSTLERPKHGKSAKALTKVLEQSERVKHLLKEAAEKLSTVNEVLKQKLAENAPPPVVREAIEKNEVAEEKVQDASEQLAVVNAALESEIKDRHVLEFQYAAAIEQKEAARHESLHDPMTGLPNRALFNDRLEQGLVQAERHGWNCALMFVDLDNLNEINDSYGHDVGDRVLQKIASRLMQHARTDDTISQLSGEEFLYLLLETGDEEVVQLIAENLINIIQAPCDVGAGDRTISPIVRASIGIAMFPHHGALAETLIKCSGRAMYRAKKDKSGFAFAG